MWKNLACECLRIRWWKPIRDFPISVHLCKEFSWRAVLLIMWRFVIFLTLRNSIRKRCSIYLHFYNFSTMRWHMQLKAFGVDDKHPCILNVQCHHCWLSGDARTIASATMLLTRFSGIPTIKFNCSFTHFFTIQYLSFNTRMVKYINNQNLSRG